MVAISDKQLISITKTNIPSTFACTRHIYSCDICLLFDDVAVYLNLIGVQDFLHAELAQPRNC